MRSNIPQKLLDTPSVWCIRLLCALALIVTCVLVFTRSPRAVWATGVFVSLLLLSAVNRVRIRSRIKRPSGTARRPKRERVERGEYTKQKTKEENKNGGLAE